MPSTASPDTGPDVSVVMPTYNRLDRLQRALAGLQAQVGLDQPLEVIVVADGCTDGTNAWLCSSHVPLPVVAITQDNGGPAVARNTGVSAATGRLVLFIDDDVVPATDLVAAHIRHHRSLDDDLVVIGRMNTPDDQELSPWVAWEQDMLYKQYDAMERGDWEATPRQFYTGNASLARRHLQSAGGFDPRFRRAEDVELAYRLADTGLEFAYAPDACVVHYAERSFDSWRANAVAYGHNDVIFGRDEGHAWLLDAILDEFHDRHRSLRALTELSLRHPLLGQLVTATIAGTAHTAARTGPRRVSRASLSALYNLEYYRGMADELGGGAELLGRLDTAQTARS